MSTSTVQYDRIAVRQKPIFTRRLNISTVLLFRDVSSVTSMHGMFSGATYFNQDLNLWNTRQVADFSSTFKGVSWILHMLT